MSDQQNVIKLSLGATSTNPDLIAFGKFLKEYYPDWEAVGLSVQGLAEQPEFVANSLTISASQAVISDYLQTWL